MSDIAAAALIHFLSARFVGEQKKSNDGRLLEEKMVYGIQHKTKKLAVINIK